MTEDQHERFDAAMTFVRYERQRQYQKWGRREPGNETLAVVLIALQEELGEASEAWLDAGCSDRPGSVTLESMRHEFAQIAALAVAGIEACGARDHANSC